MIYFMREKKKKKKGLPGRLHPAWYLAGNSLKGNHRRVIIID